MIERSPPDNLNEITEDAINHLCKYVQDRLGIDRGDFAGIYWAEDVPRDAIRAYIEGEMYDFDEPI
jgi:hypothetical protein